jgi:hypothetical protein
MKRTDGIVKKKMKKVKKVLTLCILALLAALPGPVWAVGANMGFEDGEDPTGWTVIPPSGENVEVTSGLIGQGYLATEGANFALLNTGAPGSLTSISQVFDVVAGSTLAFDWFFYARDVRPNNDSVKYEIWYGQTHVEEVLADVNGVGDFGQTGWNTKTYIFPVSFSGTATFLFGIADGGGDRIPWGPTSDSFAGLDNVRIIPEPLTVLGVLAGVGGLGGYLRRRLGAARPGRSAWSHGTRTSAWHSV